MCKRDTTDPLLRAFLDVYRINLLAVPRAQARVGDVYVRRGQATSAPGFIGHVLAQEFELPPVQEDEELSDLRGRLSQAVSVRAGLGLLGGFLGALGAPLAAARVTASYERGTTRSLHFRLADATRSSLDPFLLGMKLRNARLDAKNPFIQDGQRYYVTTAVIWATSLTILAEDGAKAAVDVDVDVGAGLLDAEAGLSVEKGGAGELRYEGKRPLAIGVELHELLYDREQKRFLMQFANDIVRVRSEGPVQRQGAFIGDEKRDDAFVTIDT
jgi:hypothetical protein